MSLSKLVEEYHLRNGQVDFWVPYWTNQDVPPYRLGEAYRGKGTPAELLNVLRRRTSSNKAAFASSHDYRRFMRGQGLGVDCSGFAFHILRQYVYDLAGVTLASQLLVDRADIETSLSRPSWQKTGITVKDLTDWPDILPLDLVCRRFGKQARMLTNVKRLTDSRVTHTIPTAVSMQPGDLIKITGPDDDHIGVVVKISASAIIYADSRADSEYGGVGLRTIAIRDWNRGLEAQNWDYRKFFNPAVGDRVCRLKVLR